MILQEELKSYLLQAHHKPAVNEHNYAASKINKEKKIEWLGRPGRHFAILLSS
jgi:hypothetical protein